MPDPAWSFQASFSQLPEANGFTRELYGSPVINAVTTGPQANRRLEVNTDNGGVVFFTTQIPSLSTVSGCTMEFVCSCNGIGNAGIELTFLDRVVTVQVYQNKVQLRMVSDGIPQEVVNEANTAANTSDTTFRVTFDDQNKARVYRNGTIILGPTDVPTCVKPFQRVLWWAEEGGTQIFKQIRFWLGGAMIPG